MKYGDQHLRAVSICWEDAFNTAGHPLTSKQQWSSLVEAGIAPPREDIIELGQVTYVGGLRHALRARPHRKQDDSGRLEWVRVAGTGEDGRPEDVFKPIETLSLEEEAQHITRRRDEATTGWELYEYYAREGIRRHGRGPLQALLPFALPPDLPKPHRPGKRPPQAPPPPPFPPT